MPGIATLDLEAVNKNVAETSKYIIAPNPKEIINAENVIYFNLDNLSDEIRNAGTPHLQFVIKASGYNNVTLDYTMSL
ncbi:hypothetical protein [Cytobacillus gottheilii]|uniref:Uncharacterized protein n=1 Tax=Cytobacillus gottheilii TaxID=859144 RepID=A0ABX8FA85_9BACI|nr:hypothetical protein [Cytobacillus gottheilii]QVY61303.1 hypothetical protein J1899_20540 [Cytobacillus gottheilii]